MSALLSVVALQGQSPAPQQVATPLKDIGDLLVGSWTGEGTYAADYPGLAKKGVAAVIAGPPEPLRCIVTIIRKQGWGKAETRPSC